MNFDFFNRRKSRDVKHLGILILRLAYGISMVLFHGLNKLSDIINYQYSDFPDPLGIGHGPSIWLTVFAEFVCGIFIALGFLTRLASIPLIICMGTAFLIVHEGDGFDQSQMSFLYLMAFIALFLLGGGKYSIDNFLLKKE